MAGSALVMAAATGCGEDDADISANSGLPSAGGAGAIAYALPELPAVLDPLAAEARSAQVVARQLFEPLVSEVGAPYGSTASQAGLALSVKSSPDRSVWRLALRSGVRFQDGTPFNASAVLANGRRWASSSEGRSLLPQLFAVDAPRPHEVRFQFSGPQPELPALLASPRLGIVSPQALAPRSGEGSRFRPEAAGAASGPFELGAQSETAIELVRNASWWGSAFRLGPALDAIEFDAVPEPAIRLRLLASGEAQVAEALGADGVAAVSADPLLRSAGSGAAAIGYEASVRGIAQESGVPALSRIWLTTVGD